jgi:hypothetical protein
LKYYGSYNIFHVKLKFNIISNMFEIKDSYVSTPDFNLNCDYLSRFSTL